MTIQNRRGDNVEQQPSQHSVDWSVFSHANGDFYRNDMVNDAGVVIGTAPIKYRLECRNEDGQGSS